MQAPELMSQAPVVPKCWSSDQLGTWIRIQIWGWGPGICVSHSSVPPQDGEIPHASTSGKRQHCGGGGGAALAQARGTGICGHGSLKVGPFPGWQLVGWQLESGGRLGAAGRADGVGNGDQAAPGQSPLCQHPRALAPLTNGPRFLSLICGVACNNKTLLKAGVA